MARAIDPPQPSPAKAAQGDRAKTVGTGSSSARPEPGDEAPAATSIDEKLLRSLDPTAEGADAGVDRLERAIAGMRDASKRMATADTGKQTQELQLRVVEDLERLLKQMKQQQRQSQSSQQSQSQQQDRQKLQQQQLDPKNSSSRKPQPAESESAGRERKDSPSREAQENVDAAQRARDEEARRQQMVKDVWGHLPPHLREAMLQSFREKYLPQYEDLVRRYYEALAEKNKPRSPAR